MFQPTVRVAAICGLLAWGASLLAEDQVIVKPEETDEILSNPGIGWETFHQTIKNLLPGSIEPFTSDFFKMPKNLPPGKVVPVTLTFPWWYSDIPPGEYSLSIGVVDLYARPAAVPTDKWKALEALIQAGFEPAIRLGIKGRAADGWYPLSKIQVVK